jgi:predicted adenylyl cyclase CyaB
MAFINVEIKARTTNADAIRRYLLEHGADFKGTDFQVDTYFNVPAGRLKLREGNIENSLIQYNREDQAGPKKSDFRLLELTESFLLKDILTNSLGIMVVVEKEREIYYIDNIKFHLDSVRQLGNFVEIEASNKYRSLPLETLHDQCGFYKTAFGIPDKDLIQFSYSDLLLAAPTLNSF